MKFDTQKWGESRSTFEIWYTYTAHDSGTYNILRLKSWNKQNTMTKDNSDSRVPIFDGKDYSLWKKRILLYLKWKQCNQCALRENNPSEVETEWDDNNLRAMNIIYSSITNDQLEFVAEENAALKMIKKFDQMYLKESTLLQICIRKKLDRMKLKGYEDSSTFFSKFEKQMNDFKGAGDTVREPFTSFS